MRRLIGQIPALLVGLLIGAAGVAVPMSYEVDHAEQRGDRLTVLIHVYDVGMKMATTALQQADR